MAIIVRPRAVKPTDTWRFVARSYFDENGELVDELTNITGFTDFIDSESGNVLFSHHLIAATSHRKLFISEQRLSQSQVEDDATLRDTFFWLRLDAEENARAFFNKEVDERIAA